MDENKNSDVEQTRIGIGTSSEEDKANAPKPCRDEKGHFISNTNKPSSSTKKTGKSRKQKEEEAAKEEDENTVKIKIVKDEEPLPAKEFAGRLEDMKERTASNFIKSVARRKPRRISIDDHSYYAKEVLDDVTKKYVRERYSNIQSIDVLKKAMDALSTTEGVLETYVKEHHVLRKSRFAWRSVACFLIGIMLAYSVSRAICYYRNNSITEQKIEAVVEK